MPRYLGLPDYAHGSPTRLGVLLVNLGTPDDPNPGAVRRFLAEFLWDPRVIETPRWQWWLILHGVILRIRPSRSSHAYKQIWTEAGSPLMRHSRELAQRLQAMLNISFEDTQRITRDVLEVPGHPSIPGSDRPSFNAGHPSIGGSADRAAASQMAVQDSRSSDFSVGVPDLAKVGVLGLGAAAPPVIPVELAMTYGSPSIPAALRRLQAAGARRLLVLPLYPQYSGTTTASVFDRVTTELQRWRWLPELRFINEYHDEPAYIAAVAASVSAHWQRHDRRHLLFSFHSTPKKYLLAGDPYHCQCLKTARLVSEKLRLAPSDWSISFQSRVGREEWLRPYTDDLLLDYAKGKQLHLDVVCPGFAADNLETLEEIEIRNRELFLANGGKTYHYIPALNATAAHVELLAGLVRRHTHGWTNTADAAGDADSRTRALQAGAAR
jgi:ferrochelatase